MKGSMLSVKLSKILAKKNVPHEGGMYYETPIRDRSNYKLVSSDRNTDSNWTFYDYVPAYPEIALFKYASLVFGKGGQVSVVHYRKGGKQTHIGLFPEYVIHTHTLADLFSSGASAEVIEEYVLTSLKDL